DAAGAHHCWLRACRHDRHRRAPDGTVAFGAPRPAICDREPARRVRHDRDRGGRAGIPRWLHPAADYNASATNTTLFKLNYNFLNDSGPIAGFFAVPNFRVVPPSVPAKTVPEFIAYAKANPGKISMASAGTGTPPHLIGALFKAMARVDMVHVPYRGSGPALIDLLAGQVQVGFEPMPASIEYIRAGKLRALAVTTETRSKALPNIPTMAEFLPDYEASGWYGIGAPKNTPYEIIDKLNKEIN